MNKKWIQITTAGLSSDWSLTGEEKQRRLDRNNSLKDDETYLGNLTLDEVEALGYTIHLYPRESAEAEAQDD